MDGSDKKESFKASQDSIDEFAAAADLAASSAPSSVLSIEQLNKKIRGLIEGEFELVWVKGEISNFKAHTSGHFYFSLKDPKSQIRAVMFRGYNSHLKFRPADGQEVLVRGRVTVYEPRGEYQIAVETMDPVGAGALQKAFEQLKLKLRAEGLFDLKRKRAIPKIPKHIAIVTSPTGAAIQDMMNVLRRRNPMAQVTLVPTVVQGAAAIPQICEALQQAYRLPGVDVIILGRGGGSIEDMWCFNDESVARMIVKSPAPLVSAIGHEVDFTIADFVADLRAPTPSAAAELVSASHDELLISVQHRLKILTQSFRQKLQKWSARTEVAAHRLVDPKRKLQDLMQRNDELLGRLVRATNTRIDKLISKVALHRSRLVSPEKVILLQKTNLNSLKKELWFRLQSGMEDARARLQESASLLNSLSPLRTMERGYSITMKKNKVLTAASQARVGDEIAIHLSKGTILAQVLETKPEGLEAILTDTSNSEQADSKPKKKGIQS